MELTDCRLLKVVDLSHTYVRIMPLEVCQLKQLYDLNLEGCPLEPRLKKVYGEGILRLLEYFGEKLQREQLRAKIVNAAKEDVWVDTPLHAVQDAIAKILDSLEDDTLFVVQRLLRNLKYVLPENVDQVDPFVIRLALTTSKVGFTHEEPTQIQHKQSMSTAENFGAKGRGHGYSYSLQHTMPHEISKVKNEFRSHVIDNKDSKVETEASPDVKIQDSTCNDKPKAAETKGKTATEKSQPAKNN